MSGRHRKSRRFSRLHLFRLGEYGVFLAIIPGTILSILTGQCAFVISPITLSLWLNLILRSYGYRSTYQLSVGRHQEAMHRFESVVELVRRKRASFLVDNAGRLMPRDQPQCLQVLAFRANCVEQNRESLALYLAESSKAMAQDIALLQKQYLEQQQQVDRIRFYFEPASGWDSEFLSDVYVQFGSLSARINQLNLYVSPSDHCMTELQDRVMALQDDVAKRMQSDSSYRKSELIKAWVPIQNVLQERLDAVATHYELKRDQVLKRDDPSWHQTLTAIQHSLSDHLHTWEHWIREQNYKLLRLQEKGRTIKHFVDAWSPLTEIDAFIQEVIEQCSHLDVIENNVTRELDLVKRHLVDLRLFCDSYLDLELLESCAEESIAIADENIQVLSSRLPTLSTSVVMDLAQLAVRPLQDQLNHCDQQLTDLTSSFSNDAIAIQIVAIETHLKTLFRRLEMSMDISNDVDDVDFGSLYVQLSMIRVKLEELNYGVALGVQQIPYLVESQIRHKFASQTPSILVSSPPT